MIWLLRPRREGSIKKKYLLLSSLIIVVAALLVMGSHAHADDTVFDEIEYNGASADHIEQALIMGDFIDKGIR